MRWNCDAVATVSTHFEPEGKGLRSSGHVPKHQHERSAEERRECHRYAAHDMSYIMQLVAMLPTQFRGMSTTLPSIQTQLMKKKG
jgi:hypothetical protein